MLVTCFRGEVEKNEAALSYERFRFFETMGGFEELSEVVESYRDMGVLRTEGAFVDLKGPSNERLGLFEMIGGLEELSEIVEVYGDIGVLRTEGAFVDLKRTLHERFGLLETIGGLE